MRNEITKIIEEMGFRKVCNEYIADFEDSISGDIIEIVVKETADENGIGLIEFHCFSERGDFVGKYMLDQIIEARACDLTLVPTKTNKKYQSTYHVEIAVPVDMSCVRKETFREWFNEGCETEESISERIARKDLSDWLDRCPFKVLGTEPGYTEEI